MIKVPATPAGLDALEELCAAGVTLNVTLIFSDPAIPDRPRCRSGAAPAARVARAVQERLQHLRLAVGRLHREARARSFRPPRRAGRHRQRQADLGREPASSGPSIARRLQQEMIFASTGTKKPEDPPWKYVEAFAGSDIETNPPATNEAVAEERPHVHAAQSINCRRGRARRNRSAGRHRSISKRR